MTFGSSAPVSYSRAKMLQKYSAFAKYSVARLEPDYFPHKNIHLHSTYICKITGYVQLLPKLQDGDCSTASKLHALFHKTNDAIPNALTCELVLVSSIILSVSILSIVYSHTLTKKYPKQEHSLTLPYTGSQYQSNVVTSLTWVGSALIATDRVANIVHVAVLYDFCYSYEVTKY